VESILSGESEHV